MYLLVQLGFLLDYVKLQVNFHSLGLLCHGKVISKGSEI